MSIPAPRMNENPSIPSLMHPIGPELRLVEQVLNAELSSAVKTVFAASRHILEAGGKRLRPSLVILSARACPGNCDAGTTANVAAGIELVHMATLMHDDVIDASESRRGRVTANSVWGNDVSVLTGDYMLSKATSLLVRAGDMRIIQALSEATVAMTEGEISQIEARGDAATSSAHYLSIIRDKTAEFMSACCRIGAILAGDSPRLEEALAAYGLNLGMVFQVTDDLLDLIGDPALTGKPVGSDIREGKVTLPIILALEKADPVSRASLESIVRRGASAVDVEFVRELVQTTGAIEGSRRVAAEYAGRALEHLHILPPSEARRSLEEVACHILKRER